jgi:SMI1-KNR4 cell-wall
MIDFEHVSLPLVDADLDEVERRFDFIFPEDLRKHYLRYNGGHPKKNRFINDGRTYILHDFLPIKASKIATLSTLEKCIEWLKVDKQIIPMYLVPFASDPFGNFFCFSTQIPDFGGIYWFKIEGRRKMEGDFLSSSFNDFLNKLRSKTDDISLKDNGVT